MSKELVAGGRSNKAIKFRKYKTGRTEPESTVTIPLSVFKLAAKLMPKKALAAMKEQDIDIEHLQEVAEKEELYGMILEAEDHVKGERMVISVE